MHPKSQKNVHNCVSETQREKDYRKVQKNSCPAPIKHSFCIGVVVKITFSFVSRNIPKRSPTNVQKQSQNPYKRVSGSFRTNSLKKDVEKESHAWKSFPKWTPQFMKKQWKNGPGHPGAAEAHLYDPGKLWGYPPWRKHTENNRQIVWKKTHSRKTKGTLLQETSLCAAGWAKPIWIKWPSEFEFIVPR